MEGDKKAKVRQRTPDLTAAKGVAVVVMDRKDYSRKMKELLDDNNTYRPLKMDPTNRQKNRLINILGSIKTEGR